MSTWTLYHTKTGLFTGSILCCPENHLAGNVPDEAGAIMGEYDYLSERMDLETGHVVSYIPDQPSINHVWNVISKRWKYVPTDNDIAMDIRAERNRRISLTDWTQLGDVDKQVADIWKVYRKALRDISLQVGFPRTVAWPSAPA
jgi:hypothetical protein